MKFNVLIVACIALLSLVQSAIAQYGSTGSYAGLGSSGSTAISYGSSGSSVSYASSGSAVSYGCTGSASKSYGSTGSSAASYGCTGSAATKDFRPMRSILENKPIRSVVRATLDLQPVRSRVSAVASVAANVGSAYQVALASAQYRAANGIRHHSAIERGYTSGVGFSTYSSTPMTCLGAGGSNYAVVRGSDGWYATKIQ